MEDFAPLELTYSRSSVEGFCYVVVSLTMATNEKNLVVGAWACCLERGNLVLKALPLSLDSGWVKSGIGIVCLVNKTKVGGGLNKYQRYSHILEFLTRIIECTGDRGGVVLQKKSCNCAVLDVRSTSRLCEKRQGGRTEDEHGLRHDQELN